MRTIEFANDEHYHLYNRGVDKRDIFIDRHDLRRFLRCLNEFNTVEPIGSIYENSFRKEESAPSPLIKLICYALNQNHFHLLVQQVAERGVEKFMHRLSMGFSKYFNHRRRRLGALFQGPYQAKHIDSNEYLLRISAYINLNDRVHQPTNNGGSPTLSQTSWKEFISAENSSGLCHSELILKQFKDCHDYQIFAEDSLADILENKELLRELEDPTWTRSVQVGI